MAKQNPRMYEWLVWYWELKNIKPLVSSTS